MVESSDQSAAVKISPDQPQTSPESPPVVEAKVEQEVSSPAETRGSSEPHTGPRREAIGLPVPVPAQNESGAAGKMSTQKTALPEESPLSIDAAAPPRHAKAEVPFRAFPPRHFPPRQKKNWHGDIWTKAAALAIAVGIGWIAGANTFDRTAEVHRLASQLNDTDAKLAALAKKTAHVAPATDVAAVKTDFSTQKKNVDGLSKGLDAQRAAIGNVKTGLDSVRGELDAIKASLQSTQNDFAASKSDLAASKSDVAKIDRLGERVDRLEHQVSSSVPTGSISAAPAGPLAAKEPHPAAAPKEPKAPLEKSKIPPNGYVLRDVQGGVAIVEDQSGIHQVVPGEMLAGIGRVQSIERHAGRWVVVTSDGLIDSEPY